MAATLLLKKAWRPGRVALFLTQPNGSLYGGACPMKTKCPAGGTLGFGGLSLTIDRDEEEVVAAPEELPPEPSIDDGVEAGTETIETVNPVECPEQEAPEPIACDSSIADSLRDQLLDTRTQLSKCKARRRADDD